MFEKWKQYQYYVLIGVISLIAVFFLPFVGSEAGLAWILPTTTAGWIVYVITKLIIAGINILLFHCFIQQGKTNILENKRYIEANKILEAQIGGKEYQPRSPKQWSRSTYGKKGVTIFLTSILSAIGLTQAVLTFDWISMLTYLFTIIMGIVFGIIQMSATENYWTNEYWLYAQKVKENKNAEKDRENMALVAAKPIEPHNDIAYTTGRTTILVSSDSTGTDGIDY